MATGQQASAGDGSGPAAQSAGVARSAAARANGAIPPAPWSREAGARRSSRADKPALSREAIVRAAIRIIDEEGFDAVSMRRVAQEFGTGAASLYAYVANKDELMDLIVDQMMAQTLMPPREPAEDVAGWQEQLKDMVRAGYQVLASHRDISRALFGRIPFGPNGLRNVEAMLGLLRARGLPDHIAAYAGDLLGQYIVGTAFEDYVWQQRYPGADLEQVNAAMTEVGDYLESLPREQFPNLTALARTMVGQGPDAPLADRFELGLDIIVRGLTAFLPAGNGD